jgi:hypothetical protein
MIVFNRGHCTLGCQILDVSETGAMVRPSDIFLCPPEICASAEHRFAARLRGRLAKE